MLPERFARLAFRVLLTAPHRWLKGRPAGVTFKASITERHGEPAIARDPGFAQSCRVLATACLVLPFYSSESRVWQVDSGDDSIVADSIRPGRDWVASRPSG
jgi:hypothetical protein